MKQTQNRHSFRHGILMSTVYCLCVALIFQVFRGIFHPDYEFAQSVFSDLMISLGYGYGAVSCAHLAIWLRPSLTFKQINIIALVGGVTLGSLNSFLWNHDSYQDFFLVVLLGLIFSSICLVIFYMYEKQQDAQHMLEESRRQHLEQEKALILSQLRQLQSQIEPHFLFNTLANLNVLIDKDPELAKTLLEKLTDLLRATLKKNRRDLVTLEDELDLIDTYLGIQQIRLGERLSYVIHQSVKKEDLLLPPMLIQPLVENALKHGIEPQSCPGRIEVKVSISQDHLIIQVKDNGQGLKPQMLQSANKGHGVGLESIRQRLQALYDGQGRLTIRERQSGGVTTEIALPLSALRELQEQ